MLIKIVLAGENPHLMGGMPLLLSQKPDVEASNTNVTISMPSDAVMLTGSQSWAGDLKAN